MRARYRTDDDGGRRKEGDLAWEQQVDDFIHDPLALGYINNVATVFAATNNGTVYAFRRMDGTPLWVRSVPEVVFVAPIYCGGASGGKLVLGGADTKQTYVMNVETEGVTTYATDCGYTTPSFESASMAVISSDGSLQALPHPAEEGALRAMGLTWFQARWQGRYGLRRECNSICLDAVGAR